MTPRTLLPSAALLLCLPVLAFASGGERPSEPSSRTDPSTTESRPALTPREQAERLYGDAYDEVAKSREDEQSGKAKNATKRLTRALDRASEAVQLDTTYYQAWNLVGYTSRKLGDYPKSLAAYRTCLRLKPDYAPARQYYGEALAESGDLKGAEAQLAWLRNAKQDALATELDQALAPRRGAAAPDSAR